MTGDLGFAFDISRQDLASRCMLPVAFEPAGLPILPPAAGESLR
jgi:hypothetical protein